MAGQQGAEYRDIGPTLPLSAVLDTTGLNPFGVGNWNVIATQKELNCYVAQAEVYHTSIQLGPVGSNFVRLRGTRVWDAVLQGWSNYDDPYQPLIIRKGDEVRMFWNSGATPAPVVTMWIRYDINLPENRPFREPQ